MALLGILLISRCLCQKEMEFFGITYYGPQNYIKDSLQDHYLEPLREGETKMLMQKIIENNPCPEKRPILDIPRTIDCYHNRVNGFAYGSISTLQKMKKKGVVKPVGPADIYRLPITTFEEIGSWQCDPAIINKVWYKTIPRYPQVMSENSKLLEIVRLNGSKYTRLF